MNCLWNRGCATGYDCSKNTRKNGKSVQICDECEALRDKWLLTLQAEDKSGFTKRQLLEILNTHKSVTACRQILRIMHEHRVVSEDDDDIPRRAPFKEKLNQRSDDISDNPEKTKQASSSLTLNPQITALAPASSASAADLSISAPTTTADTEASPPAAPALPPSLPLAAPNASHSDPTNDDPFHESISLEFFEPSKNRSRQAIHVSQNVKHKDPGPGAVRAPVTQLKASSGSDERRASSTQIPNAPPNPPHEETSLNVQSTRAPLNTSPSPSSPSAPAAVVLVPQSSTLTDANRILPHSPASSPQTPSAVRAPNAYKEIPANFVKLKQATREKMVCKEMEDDTITWDVKEQVLCWKCGQTTMASKLNVFPLIIGEKDHLYRALPVKKYGSVCCVPAMNCKARPLCNVGWMNTLSAIYWDGAWVPVGDFCKVHGAADGCIEVPSELCKERVILHVLHWFSRTREVREDDHAGFPLPGIERSSSIVYREDVAAGYCTFDSDLVEENDGWRLPTFYNIFIRAPFRSKGCARQLLCSFFRPSLSGKTRIRQELQTVNGSSVTEVVTLNLGNHLDYPCQLYLDKLQIDPPVSNALIAAMKKIFTPNELDNIVCDSGRFEGGSLTYIINPAEPKTRVFRPQSIKYNRFPRDAKEKKVIGGIVPDEQTLTTAQKEFIV